MWKIRWGKRGKEEKIMDNLVNELMLTGRKEKIQKTRKTRC